jgi:rhomboid protease GluP
MRRRAPVTFTLLAIIAIVFAVEYWTNAVNDDEVLYGLGAILPLKDLHGQYWRFLTGMFLHAGVLHWLVNSWAIFQLGTLYEALFGSKRFALVYFVSGLAASLASSLHGMGMSVGASGAVFGVMGAFIFSILRSPRYRHQPWVRGLVGQIVFWIILNLAIGASIKVIDNAAHVGGLVAGLLLGLIPHRTPPPNPRESIIDVRPQPYDEGGF